MGSQNQHTTAQVGDHWTIVQNDGTDAFDASSFQFTNAGNPIGELVPFSTGGQLYVLDYAGGTGNDVVLTVVPEPTASAFTLLALPLLGLSRWRRTRTIKK